MARERLSRPQRTWRKLAWFAVLYLAGIVTIGVIAGLLRLLIT